MSKHMRKFLGYAFRSGDIVELRAMMKDGTIVAGRFTDLDNMASQAADVDTWAETSSVFFCINPIDPAKAKRIGHWNANQLKPKPRTTGDSDVLSRRLYFLDFDPQRPKGVCSTAEEKQAAFELMQLVVSVLREAGFPEPLIVDSGNGYHVYYLSDGADGRGEAWPFVLKHLSATYSTEDVKIDTVVGNASRISRLPDTWNRKGPSTPERPHRRCKVVSYPEKWEPLAHHVIYRLAAKNGYLTPEERAAKRSSSNVTSSLVEDARELLEQFIAESEGELEVAAVRQQGEATYFDLKTCPFAGRAHSGALGKTAIILTDTFVGFHCFSDDCDGLGFGDLRKQLERLTGQRSTISFYERVAIEDDEVLQDAIEAWGVEDADDEEDNEEAEEEDEPEIVEADEREDDYEGEVNFTREDLLALKRMLPYPHNVRFTRDEIDLIANWKGEVAA